MDLMKRFLLSILVFIVFPSAMFIELSEGEAVALRYPNYPHTTQYTLVFLHLCFIYVHIYVVGQIAFRHLIKEHQSKVMLVLTSNQCISVFAIQRLRAGL